MKTHEVFGFNSAHQSTNGYGNASPQSIQAGRECFKATVPIDQFFQNKI